MQLSSYGTQGFLLFGMWDSPGPGIKLMSLALAGRFFTTEPLGSPFLILTALFSGFLVLECLNPLVSLPLLSI